MTAPPPAARLIVARTHASDVQQRQVYVSLDGAPLATMVYGDVCDREIPPGPHTLRFNNTLVWKTVQFAIEPGEHLEFIVINSARWWTAGMAGLLGAAPLFLRVEKRSLV